VGGGGREGGGGLKGGHTHQEIRIIGAKLVCTGVVSSRQHHTSPNIVSRLRSLELDGG
jgi:hypothetical protein